jgi:hypothetical protein
MCTELEGSRAECDTASIETSGCFFEKTLQMQAAAGRIT